MTIDQIYRGMTPRLLFLMICFAALPVLLIARLWYEQVRIGGSHREKISQQSIRRVRIPAIRGRIFDRNGVALADNSPSYDVLFHVHELKQPARGERKSTVAFTFEQIERVARIIGRGNDITLDQIKRHIRVYPALPFRAGADLTEQELARLYEEFPGVQGMEITTDQNRLYPHGEVGAHILGFVGPRDPAFEDDRNEYAYFMPELTGRRGQPPAIDVAALESVYDDLLRGKGGARLVRVDCRGFFHEEVTASQPAMPGADLMLTVDSRAQRIAQSLMEGKRGAIVVLACGTGAVTALVSAPSYDLNTARSRYSALAADRANNPLLNRALAASFMPGSIIKPLIALGILEHQIDSAEAVICPGYYKLGNTRIWCWDHDGHGPVTLVDAIEVSCNTYFISTGLRVGLDRLRPLLQNAGIGSNPGLELQMPRSQAIFGCAGLLPTREWKRHNRGKGWKAYDTAAISIGQGYISISPLQAALYAAAIANGGIVYRPYVVKEIRGHAGTQLTRRRIKSRLPVSQRNLAIVREGMRRAVNGENATAFAAMTDIFEVAGKTGSAEVVKGKRTDAWFICFAPAESPRYAMAVLVENGKSGGKSAAPLAKEFFKQYFTAQ